ncbi:hypothetical protein [Caulobacter phage KcrB]|nr:hypothetical protein RW_GP007c [Caulobacter phage RW]WCA46311.1 hypothetical protein [Caulobacter phage KcrB]WCD56246.1 hypothetical protein [Caulobacter phage RLK]WNV48038.1 hypothetical protein GB2A_gp006c [Caulobacter phage GB2A]QDH50464.1 hypothetical protein RW_GP103c [Caulobacter phage RW]
MTTQKITFKKYGDERRPLYSLAYDGHVFGDATAYRNLADAVREARRLVAEFDGQYVIASDSFTRAMVASVEA